MTLARTDFATIFHSVHGQHPFAWQERLLDEIIRQGWPATIAAPTGTGKTAVIDIALFHFALEASPGAMGNSPRGAARRIVFAVDRRVIVDQAFTRSSRLKCALEQAASGPLAEMASALRTHQAAVPLHVEQLRGGMPREDDWALSPAQPTILCTTIDQLGSRLLFRAYGASPAMAPIHAGLLGEDALILLDEAHLSNPFRETLAAIARRRVGTSSLSLPWAVSTLTATPAGATGATFSLTPAERAEPAIARRLSASKSAELQSFKANADSAECHAAIATAAEAIPARCTRPDPTVAVIVNRVPRARAVFEELFGRGHETILLTGRARPVERDDLLASYGHRLLARTREAESASGTIETARPLFVVATQCIEAGADFDFDAMLAEIAPLDALIQRFGRLNRLGNKPGGPAVIFAARDQIARTAKDDPIYGDRARLTWDWLLARVVPTTSNGLPSLEVSPNALAGFVAADPAAASCMTDARSAPILRAADVAFFAITNPAPYPDPCLPLYLHGTVNISPDVAIVWRADCDMISRDPAAPEQPADEKAEDKNAAIEIVALMPPRPGEALSVPIWAARAWLGAAPGQATHAAGFGDTGSETPPAEEHQTWRCRRALRWRGAENQDTDFVTPGQFRPGDTIIVPASYGGCDRFGWAPASVVPTDDIADRAAGPYASRYFALRLHPKRWPPEEGAPSWETFWPAIATAADNGRQALLDALAETSGLPRRIAGILPALRNSSRVRIEYPYDRGDAADPSGLVLIAPHGLENIAKGLAPLPGFPATEDDRSGSFAAHPATIREHAAAVEGQVLAFAAAIGLGPFSASLAFAARHHDDGKADPRFQAWLAGPEEPPPAEPLAKSGRWRGALAERSARKAAALPPEWRHEALSVRLAAQRLPASTPPGVDADLALYLIGTHHGQGRPFFRHHDPWDAAQQTLLGVRLPPSIGPERLDFDWHGMDWVELTRSLQARYGIWSLAFLEAVLRLSDHRASEASRR